MKDNMANMTIQSIDIQRLMTDILESTPEQLSGFLEIALRKILVDTGADHVFISVIDFEIHQTRTRFEHFDTQTLIKTVKNLKAPLILNAENYSLHPHQEMLYKMMKKRFIDTWMIIPLGMKNYLSIEYTATTQQPEVALSSIEWFTKTLSFKLKYMQLIQDFDQTILAKSEFLSNMSHEIRTPLSGIYNAFYLLNTTGLSQEQLEYVSNGMTSVDHLSSIIDDVLDYATIESGNITIHETKLDLEGEMIRLLKQYKPSADEKKLNMSYHFDFELQREYLGDIIKIRQIIGQVLDNAIKYTDKGSIDLSISKRSTDDMITWVSISIKDSGIGIPHDKLSTIQHAFVQIESSESKRFQGTGLGLSIATELINLLNGQLEVESVLKEGSQFTVVLPLKNVEQSEMRQLNHIKALIITKNNEKSAFINIFESIGIECFDLSNAHQSKMNLMLIEDDQIEANDVRTYKSIYGLPNVITLTPMLGHEFKFKDIDVLLEWPISRQALQQKIYNHLMQRPKESVELEFEKELKGHALLVDDNRLNRVALQSILLKQGIRSTTVESGQKAIELVKKETFDIIFMDIQMPIMDGLETTRRIRHLGEIYEQIPIIAITANQYFKDYDLMKSTQINDVLFKPIRMEQLGQVLRKYIPSERGIIVPEDLVVFDISEFSERFDGSDDIAIEVMHTFLEEYQQDLVHIAQAIALKDPKRIHETTHYFKGSCAYLSGKRAVWLLSQMTQLAKQNRLESMAMLQNLLEKEVELLVKSVRSKLK